MKRKLTETRFISDDMPRFEWGVAWKTMRAFMHAQESTETMTCTMLPKKKKKTSRQVEARFVFI